MRFCKEGEWNSEQADVKDNGGGREVSGRREWLRPWRGRAMTDDIVSEW